MPVYNQGYNNNYGMNGYGQNQQFGNQMYGNNFGNGYAGNQVRENDNRYQWVDYVNGRAGADVYPLPTGVNRALLIDDEHHRMFIKTYDNMGRPKVVEDYDFMDHVEPEPVAAAPNIDLSAYATKDDIRQMIAESFRNVSMPNLSGYVTQTQLDSILNNLVGKLSVGAGGKVVVTNESNA